MIKKFIYFYLLWVSSFAHANDLAVTIVDHKNIDVANAVVTLTPNRSIMSSTQAPPVNVSIIQQGAMFNPFVLAIPTGTKVHFPNKDNFRHHVYSFSKAKRFQLRLYDKDEEKFITFDKPGIAALGCNIHDNMLAFVYISEAPLIATTDTKGEAIFKNITAGDYKMTVWHPDLKKDSWASNKNMQINITATPTLRHQIELTTLRRTQEKPNFNSGNYSQ